MELDLKNINELNKAKVKFSYLCSKGALIELTEKRSTRSSLQNKALHKYFLIIVDALNELGMEFQYFGLKGQVLETRYTTTIVKNQFWRQLQITMFDIESTKDINTKQMNEIIDVIDKFFAERGVYVQFPDKDQLKDEEV